MVPIDMLDAKMSVRDQRCDASASPRSAVIPMHEFVGDVNACTAGDPNRKQDSDELESRHVHLRDAVQCEQNQSRVRRIPGSDQDVIDRIGQLASFTSASRLSNLLGTISSKIGKHTKNANGVSHVQ